ncbi:serine hydrolase domain-containing protein [Jiulongibacter sediminis]|uniref:Beta-lactamase-related domain-containing protein n=1 Tax=Jiulongibacter sediminis TaxID=1605367 RepID=A0A0P7C5V8_9BACT|nr:serine hydrolase [Jiulongibacter sediminis]KPM48720.1 hypothetical protein AFM12_09045 [Jiulongibacter sediminis]TBX25255.1 hypothetical protein TK44_09050 [Jiulongibacter sediminis]
MKIRSVTLVLLLFINSCTRILPKPGDEALNSYIQNKVDKAEVVGMQAAYHKNGKLSWHKSYGVKNVETNEPVDDETLFMIASSSKPVTATAIMHMADQGKLDIDADINLYLPFEIRNPNFPEEVITSRMLLSHTSSLKDDWDTLDPLYTIEEGGDSPIPLAEFVPGYFLKGGQYYNENTNFHTKKPGNHWDYCNMGYVILGYIIQELSGKPFEQYMYEDFFEPLGMTNSYWFLRDIPHENIARPHEPVKKGTPEVLLHYGYPDFPDGQLRTTVSDYARFLEIFLNDGLSNGIQFLKPETVKEFLKIQYPSVQKHQAIAWNYNEMENFLYYRFIPHFPSHTGGDPGVATVVSFDPKTRTAAIVFMNSRPDNFLQVKNTYLDIVKRLMRAAL